MQRSRKDLANLWWKTKIGKGGYCQFDDLLGRIKKNWRDYEHPIEREGKMSYTAWRWSCQIEKETRIKKQAIEASEENCSLG